MTVSTNHSDVCPPFRRAATIRGRVRSRFRVGSRLISMAWSSSKTGFRLADPSQQSSLSWRWRGRPCMVCFDFSPSSCNWHSRVLCACHFYGDRPGGRILSLHDRRLRGVIGQRSGEVEGGGLSMICCCIQMLVVGLCIMGESPWVIWLLVALHRVVPMAMCWKMRLADKSRFPSTCVRHGDAASGPL